MQFRDESRVLYVSLQCEILNTVVHIMLEDTIYLGIINSKMETLKATESGIVSICMITTLVLFFSGK